MKLTGIICMLTLIPNVGGVSPTTPPPFAERHTILRHFTTMEGCLAWLDSEPIVFVGRRWVVKQGPRCLPLVDVRR